ncbi:hypothetical protein BD414DRAFT_167654 [Trametes punicea]|nr:hypothetical protein BD414DRAFT_167654 [Trametes punicea]
MSARGSPGPVPSVRSAIIVAAVGPRCIERGPRPARWTCGHTVGVSLSCSSRGGCVSQLAVQCHLGRRRGSRRCTTCPEVSWPRTVRGMLESPCVLDGRTSGSSPSSGRDFDASSAVTVSSYQPGSRSDEGWNRFAQDSLALLCSRCFRFRGGACIASALYGSSLQERSFMVLDVTGLAVHARRTQSCHAGRRGKSCPETCLGIRSYSSDD